MPMLCYDRLYYGNSQLVNEKAYTYKKYVCDANAKVILPLLSTEWESVFDVDKKSVVIKNMLQILINLISHLINHINKWFS